MLLVRWRGGADHRGSSPECTGHRRLIFTYLIPEAPPALYFRAQRYCWRKRLALRRYTGSRYEKRASPSCTRHHRAGRFGLRRAIACAAQVIKLRNHHLFDARCALEVNRISAVSSVDNAGVYTKRGRLTCLQLRGSRRRHRKPLPIRQI